ncbi:MAG: SMC-Scp complex subunit ScpB [Bacteroides sp.]|nr:SMC-Scp complex subunit ScpB [Prevotella sp.]MCM1407315.1 SMC-Scp complex subunit ScpB [Treponema brennaborense]MCM1469805.1 SMC-Scp complex subunit ScpB [Bacteroides sp.]
MELHLEKETALIEAIFFLETEPLDENALAKISGLSRDVVDIVLEKLNEKYAAGNSGIELSRLSGGWFITPKRDLWDYLKDRYGKKNEGKLSKAAIETLSIIAYSQPITRAEIEAIRGVSADNMIRLLSERKLIKEVGRKDVPGKPIQFGTTKEFLKFFRLNSIADLPKLDETESERFELAR